MSAAVDENQTSAESDQIFEQICVLLQPYAGDKAELKTTTDLSADLEIDSVAAMDLIMEVEDHFEVDIPINLLSEIRTVQDLVNVVQKQVEMT